MEIFEFTRLSHLYNVQRTNFLENMLGNAHWWSPIKWSKRNLQIALYSPFNHFIPSTNNPVKTWTSILLLSNNAYWWWTSASSPKIVLYLQRPWQKVLSVGESNGCWQGGEWWYSSSPFTKRTPVLNSLHNRGYRAIITVFSRISAHPQWNECRLIISS